MQRLARSVIDAVDPATEQLVIVLDSALIQSLGALPSNVIAAQRAPQVEILQQSALAITHGGLGTVKECVLLGVPMLVVPQAFDQAGNAARVEFHGIGRRASTRAGAREIRRLIDELLSDRYLERIRRLQRIFEAEQNASRAADLVDFLSRRPAEQSITAIAEFIQQQDLERN